MTDTAPAQLATLRAVLSDVLVDLQFPARRWEIVTAAETYGADHRVRSALRNLRAPSYLTLDELAGELARSGQVIIAPRADPPSFVPTTRHPVPDRRRRSPWSTRYTTAR